MTAKRNHTRSVKVGSVHLGAAHPIAVQSMCATRTQDIDATVEQAHIGGDPVARPDDHGDAALEAELDRVRE